MTTFEVDKTVSPRSVGKVVWFRNTYSWMTAGTFIIGQIIVLSFLLQFSSNTRSSFNRTLDFIAMIMLVGFTTAMVAVLYYMYPLRFGISSDGIHLKYLNRTETLYWDTVTGIERVKGDIFGGTVIKKAGNEKQIIGMVNKTVFDRMNEELGRYVQRTKKAI